MTTDKKEWTIMVYMAGDNNLSEDMITGLKGMKNIGSEANINLIALYDGSYPSAPIKSYDFSKAFKTRSVNASRKLRLEEFNIDLEEAKATAVGGSNGIRPINGRTDDLFLLKDFIPLVIKKYPATKYALILSGHSDGVIGKRLLPDGSSDVSLNLKSLRNILRDAMPVDSNQVKQKFDIIGFDGCLMGMLEVGYELKDVAKIMVASQGNIPTTGWIYDEILSEIIAEKGNMTAKQFANSIVDKYVDFNEDYAISGRSINISACDLEELEKENSLYDNVQELAGLFLDLLNLPVEHENKDREATPEEKAQFAENNLIREKFIDWMILSHYHSQTFMHSQAVDIVDFTYNLLILYRKWLAENEIMGFIVPQKKWEKTNNETLNKIQNKIKSIFDNFIEINQTIRDRNNKYILRSCSIGAEYQFSQGVSLFFPWTEMALSMIFRRYGDLKFNKTKKNWLDFISRLTALTMREYREEPLFDKEIASLISIPFADVSHREVGGREVGGREVGGRGSMEFYLYFSQIRNYKPDVFEKKYVDKESFI